MLDELMDTAWTTVQASTLLQTRGRFLFLGGFHQGLAFARDHPELARELLRELDSVVEEPDEVRNINQHLQRVARTDA